MFSNLRNASPPEAGGYEDGGGNRHSSTLRELGALLRERREAMGVSLAEVEVATRIRQKYLSALEADEWHLLPGEVVGRGFLRNYADYLGLEPNEVIDRRRAVSDMALTSVLGGTSAGSNLPPLREVDYRPKEVELKDEGDGIQRGEIRLTPVFAIVGVALLVVFVWLGIRALTGPMGSFFADMPERVAGALESPDADSELAAEAVNPTEQGDLEPAPVAAGVVNPENVGAAETNPPADGSTNSPGEDAPVVPQEANTGTGGPVPENAGQQGAVLVPTSTPEQSTPDQSAPEQQQTAPEPEPAPEQPPASETEPQPEPEPVEPAVVALPTPTPEPPAPEQPAPQQPAPQQPAPAACADARSAISAPGMNQTLSGVIGVTGNATHDNFQHFKLEYAPGFNAGGGFVYFAGSSAQVSGGNLGSLDTGALPNGEYTIRLTVVDQTGNYPPPCDVNVIIQN